jgi:hypothetical protein
MESEEQSQNDCGPKISSEAGTIIDLILRQWEKAASAIIFSLDPAWNDTVRSEPQ